MAQSNSTPAPKRDAPSETAPSQIGAEAAILGAILFDNSAYLNVADILKPNDFYATAHQKLFETMANLIGMGRLADGVTLKEYFDRDDSLKEIGGATYLARLLESAAFGPEITDYAQIVRDLSVRRSLLEISAGMKQDALSPEQDTRGEDLIASAEARLFELAETGSLGKGFVGFNTALTDALNVAEAAYQREGNISGTATCLIDLDNMLGGLHPSDLLILAGRPSMGKTSLATNIAYNVAGALAQANKDRAPDDEKKPGIVGFFSLEMSAEQLAMRILSERTGISSHSLRTGEIDRQDFEKFVEATQELQNLPLHIDDTGGISISQLTARARRLHRTHGLELLVIDYLQLITIQGGRNENRVQEVTKITMTLKSLAKELNVPILALAQLSRQVEQREDKRPQLSDLRESGSIEQDADVVMFVFRESYYLERQEPQPNPDDPNHEEKWARWRERLNEVVGTGEVIIGKQRHGPIGNVKLAFDPNITRFGNLSRQVEPDDF